MRGGSGRAASPEWSVQSVVETARRTAGPHGRTTAQVFLEPGDEPVSMLAQRIADAAAMAVPAQAPPAIGNARALSRSFHVTATPDMLSAIARQPGVRSILPGEIEDIHPQPVSVTAVE